MAKVDLGEKQACPECEKKFYDLTKRPATCPYCSTSFDPAALDAPAKPLQSNVDEPDEDAVVEADEDGDSDEEVAKELELDGDKANFGGSGAGDDGDDNGDTPDMDGFSSSDDEDEDETAGADDEEDDAVPPTQNEDEEVEEVEI